MSRYDITKKYLCYDVTINVTLSETQCKHKTDMTRATKRGMAGRIWPARRRFDTPVLESLTKFENKLLFQIFFFGVLKLET